MFQPIAHDTEISYRQTKVRAEYIQAQRLLSIAGLRQILGNTVIELGGRIHGMTPLSGDDATDVRGGVRVVLRTADESIQARIVH